MDVFAIAVPLGAPENDRGPEGLCIGQKEPAARKILFLTLPQKVSGWTDTV